LLSDWLQPGKPLVIISSSYTWPPFRAQVCDWWIERKPRLGITLNVKGLKFYSNCTFVLFLFSFSVLTL
jgi:hypothetical protein